MLKIENLYAEVDNNKILNGINLSVNQGSVHAIMGPNGTGKSTLSNILAGKQDYKITQGKIDFCGQNLFDLTIDQRAKAGIFLSFQYPVEIPGVSFMSFLKFAVNNIRKSNGLEELDGIEFLKLIRENAAKLSIKDEMLKRSVNEGFSGGEKKRFEALQMLLLKPKLAILDETDSGLDVDALQIVSEAINYLKTNNNTAFIIITHYQRILNYIQPDHVHILNHGKIIKSGDANLAKLVEETGYEKYSA